MHQNDSASAKGSIVDLHFTADIPTKVLFQCPGPASTLDVRGSEVDAKQGERSSRLGPSTQGQIDFLASLRLSLKVLKNAEPKSSVDELRSMIQGRMAELKMEASLERKHAALDRVPGV